MGDKHHAILTGSKSTALIHKYMHVCLQACLPMHVNIRANAGNVNSGNGYSRVRVLFMEFDRLSAAYRNLPSETERLDSVFGDYDHHSEHNVQRTKTMTPGRHQS